MPLTCLSAQQFSAPAVAETVSDRPSWTCPPHASPATWWRNEEINTFSHFSVATSVLPLQCCHFSVANSVLPLQCCHFSVAPSVLPLQCCPFSVATSVLPLQCCHFSVATSVLPLLCCHFCVATSVLPLQCCHFSVATSVLPLQCCHFSVATSVLPLQCCHFSLGQQSHSLFPWRIDNMEAALLPDLVPTNRLGHGWAYLKLANQQAIFRAGCKDGCDWLSA